jgi:pimeloyl-ACP methyl ester carboxylesterase
VDYTMFCRWCEGEGTRHGWFGRYVEAGPDLLHYVERGQGPNLVLVHGFLEWSYTWHCNLEALAGQARVLAPDLRGYGLSAKNRDLGHTLSDQAEVLRAFLDAKGVQQAVLCGHSMGGEIALRFALRWPERVRALVLVAASGYLRLHRKRLQEMAFRFPGLTEAVLQTVARNRRFVARALAEGVSAPEMITPADVEAYLLPARAPGAAGALLRVLQDADFGSYAERLREVQMPALLIWGREDRVVSLADGERMAKDLRGRLVVFDRCGHHPQSECAEAFNREVLSFLATL